MKPTEVTFPDTDVMELEVLELVGTDYAARRDEFDDEGAPALERPQVAIALSPEELLLEEMALHQLLEQLAIALPELLRPFQPAVSARASKVFAEVWGERKARYSEQRLRHVQSGTWTRAVDAYPTWRWDDERLAFGVLELLQPCIGAFETRQLLDSVADEIERSLWDKIAALISTRNAGLRTTGD